MLLKKPGFTMVAVLALALGIGANTALFSVVNTVLLRPLPYKEPERLVMLWGNSTKDPKAKFPSSLPNYLDWKEQNRVFENISSYLFGSLNLTGSGEPERLPVVIISGDIFQTLGVNPGLGRSFLPEEERPGNDKVAVLSHSFWQRKFGSDPNIIGRTLILDNESYSVVGVMPKDFKFLYEKAELWVPLAVDTNQFGRLSFFLSVVGRLKVGVTLEQAREDMKTVTGRLEKLYPETNTNTGVYMESLHESLVGDIKPMLFVLLGAVGFVLLIACANVANLLLARAADRQKEIAIRTALGASRYRVFGQLITESLLLSTMGGSLGLILSLWGVDFLLSLNPGTLPRTEELSIDGNVLLFTLGISFLTGLIFGLVPSLQASKPDLNVTLKEGGRGTAGAARGRLRSSLVVSEVAMALVLLIGAGLLLKSFYNLYQVNPGFNSQGLLVMDLLLPTAKYKDQNSWAAFYKEAIDRIENLPGVLSVGATTILPLSGNENKRLIYIEGRPHSGPQDYTGASHRVISPGYFKTMAVPLINGRYMTESDKDDSPPVALINQAMARRFFAGEDPVGKRLKLGRGPESKQPWLTIIGVVGDVRQRGIDLESVPEMYVSYLQSAEPTFSLAIRSNGDPLRLTEAVSKEIQTIDKDQPIANVQTMDQYLSSSVAQRRFNMLLLALFAGLALLLSAMGIYGVMSYSVAQRTHEIGIRMALGAHKRSIIGLIVKQGMFLALLGIGIGLIGSFALTRVMTNLLYGVSATDPITFVGISLLLALVALLASYIPARRATKVDPMVALRYE
jgi:putative ABC transport system permease protein